MYMCVHVCVCVYVCVCVCVCMCVCVDRTKKTSIYNTCSSWVSRLMVFGLELNQ